MTAEDATALRSRTITWTDPAAAVEAGRQSSGLEYLRALAAGELPMSPIGVLMGFTGLEVDEGEATFWAEPGEHHLNPLGGVHGGVAATLLDSATGCAVHTTLPAGVGYTTTDLHVSFVRGIRPDAGPLRCEGRVVHRGRRIATAEGRLFSEGDDRLVAHGTATCLVLGG